jgi:hypothetical protein
MPEKKLEVGSGGWKAPVPPVAAGSGTGDEAPRKRTLRCITMSLL